MNNISETKKFYYDSENRMIKYEHYPSESSPKDTTAEYIYDIFGRRLQKKVNGTITKFLYDGTAVSYELDKNNQPLRKYFIGYRNDEILGHLNYGEVSDWGGFIQNPMNQGGYIYFTDQVGTIEKVAKDNSTGEIKEQRTYDVFGNLINRTGENTTPIGFQSKYYDTESGLYYYYHRYYDPKTGRFITEDPIGISGGLNLYRFVNNNPVNYVDPWGLYGKNWVKEHNLAAGKEIDSNTILDVDEYMHYLWDVAKYTMKDTWKMVTAPCFVRCMSGCMLLPTATQTAGEAEIIFMENKTIALYKAGEFGEKVTGYIWTALEVYNKTSVVLYLLYGDYCTYKCVKEYYND